ncbi:peptidyl-dipeptidase [Pluralibacter gergoviae]|uniref:Peptidyl-dipeptidase n=1 Tax=Pluralibacter gergoviae TaxID=61647 RepID=A0A0J5LUX1_PLUGE|nr:peptidyl-dipeptidase [Pluralibacter gergoviae]KMK23376.1 peptidyl-dipeptidase [Pluralibacter gergoviae]
MSSQNPFLSASLLPYQAPRFDLITEAHYQPAFEEGLKRKRMEVAAIADNPAAATFENTLVALERSGELLDRVTAVFFAMAAAHTSDTIQQLEETFAAGLAALDNDIYLNPALFARVEQVRAQNDAPDDESRRLVEVIYQRFVLAGANLSDSDKQILRGLNTEAAALATQFNHRLLAAAKGGGLVLEAREQLDGFSDDEIAAAADAAREKGLEGRWLIPLLNFTQQPALARLRDRQVRERLFNAGWRATTSTTRRLSPTLS